MKNIRFGLCCKFEEHPVRFRVRQAKYLLTFDRAEQLRILSETVLDNCRTLLEAVRVCRGLNVGSLFSISLVPDPMQT